MLVFCRLSRLIQSIIIAPNIGSWCGTAEVTIGEKVRAVHEDESATSLSAACIGWRTRLELIEVQTEVI